MAYSLRHSEAFSQSITPLFPPSTHGALPNKKRTASQFLYQHSYFDSLAVVSLSNELFSLSH